MGSGTIIAADESMEPGGGDHWRRHAAQWRYIGPPLRPVPEDLGLLQAFVARWRAARPDRGPARVLLLGVTPEIASMQWPADTRVYGSDRSFAMIRAVWPVRAACAAGAVNTLWQRLPFPPACFDLVLGDGSFAMEEFPAGYHRLCLSLRQVLRPDGRLIARFYVRPEEPESADQVFSDLRAGRIGSFHTFKWRLAMALYDGRAQRVRLSDIWQRWHDERLDAQALSGRTGWAPEVIATIDAYRGAPACYSFPTLDELRATLAAGFREDDCRVPGYELGERCPILLLTPI